MSEPRSRNWLKISCIGCVGLPCVMLMFTFGFIKCQVSKEGENLAPELAKLRKLGVPTEPNELNPNPPVPDAQNAAPVYKKIAQLADEVNKTASNRERDIVNLNRGYTWNLAESRAALAKYRAVFALIDTLPSKSGFDMKHDYSKGFMLEFTEYSTLKNVSKMLTARSHYLIGEKKYDQALRDVETQYVVANHLSEDPTLIGALVCIALNAIADASLDRLLEAIKDNQSLLAKTEAMLVRRQKLPNFRRALQGEMVLGRVGIQKLGSWKEFEMTLEDEPVEPTGLERTWDRMTVGDPGVKRMFEARSLAMWRELFENYPKNESDWPAIKKVMDGIESKISADNSLQNKMNQILFPVFSQAGQSMAKTQASHRVALLAVKLLRMRSNGLPKDLSQFGTLAIDPMDGKPMRYEQKGKGFKVWSIGADMVDHKGTKQGTGTSYGSTDIVFGYDIGIPLRGTKPKFGTPAPSAFGGP